MSPYFECDYFDPAYFDTDCSDAVDDGHHPVKIIRRRRRPVDLVGPEPPELDDDELIALI